MPDTITRARMAVDRSAHRPQRVTPGAASLDPIVDEPLYEQIARAFRERIVSGGLPAGSRLPPARGLARVHGVSYMTVVRAYRTLRDYGFVRLDRRGGRVIGRGATVDPARTRELLYGIRESVQKLAQLGVSQERIVEVVREGMVSP